MKRRILLSIVAAFIFCYLSPAKADTITFNLDTQFSGDLNLPPGQSSWLTATFSDLSNNEVGLTMTATGIVSANQYVFGWYFNFTGAAALSFIYSNGIKDNPAQSPRFADAAERPFDIFFDFSQQQFGAGGTSTYSIYGNGISAQSFFATNTPGDFFAAAEIRHLSGNSDDKIAWIAATSNTKPAPVPEPATMLLLGSGLAGMAAFGRKKILK